MVLGARILVRGLPKASLPLRKSFSTNSHRYSPERLSISKLLESSDAIAKSGSPITVEGWVRSVRKMKNVGFASIGDGSTIHGLQVVLEPSEAKQPIPCKRSIIRRSIFGLFLI
ncbi:hypothetical protein BJ508DRAFT_59068 [Ascobolus immersus RN42]|uniref:OB domain-containing protein n=1 Tax=Ascobolus immersus RN42 TaxID=1160509 RepID=A0A3N4HFB5_ASCIM|nr:hypothetical protein BJ508DRAFT_59068 [Ascobolus immersus RN42]